LCGVVSFSFSGPRLSTATRGLLLRPPCRRRLWLQVGCRRVPCMRAAAALAHDAQCVRGGGQAGTAYRRAWSRGYLDVSAAYACVYRCISVRVQVRVCVSVHMLEDEFFFSFFLFME